MARPYWLLAYMYTRDDVAGKSVHHCIVPASFKTPRGERASRTICRHQLPVRGLCAEHLRCAPSAPSCPPCPRISAIAACGVLGFWNRSQPCDLLGASLACSNGIGLSAKDRLRVIGLRSQTATTPASTSPLHLSGAIVGELRPTRHDGLDGPKDPDGNPELRLSSI